MKKSVLTIFILIVIIVVMADYIFLDWNKSGDSSLVLLGSSLPASISSPSGDEISAEFKTFVFDNFHGSTDISDKFQFQYPASWHNEGQYFSPEKIQYYTKFTVKAPIHFDLVLAEVFHLTELQYQIDNSKKRNPDSTGQIDGREFKRYDLIDYGSYGGESAGRVKIFVGPKIKIDVADYYLVFYWEEKPLAEYMQDNNISVFDNMLLTLKFFQ